MRITTLSPPGFGAPLPTDFEPTASGYRNWLIGELERHRTADDQPIDIVGHDWGAAHVFGLASERPDLVRSWAADIGGLLHPDYVWHDARDRLAAAEEIGEQMIDMMVGLSVADRRAVFRSRGLPDRLSDAIAAGIDADMGRAILALYRSTPESDLQALADRLAVAEHGPGTIITTTDDDYVPAELAGPVAARLGVEEIMLEGQGHWWMVGDPDGATDRLVSFWSGL